MKVGVYADGFMQIFAAQWRAIIPAARPSNASGSRQGDAATSERGGSGKEDRRVGSRRN